MTKNGGTQRRCHYCGKPAKTRDHIVPKSRAIYLGGQLGAINIVPACAECNGKKSDYRSDCSCPTCTHAWRTLGPAGWHNIPIVKIVDAEGLYYA